MNTLVQEQSTNSSLRVLLDEVLRGHRLVDDRAESAIELLCDPEADTALQTALLSALRARGESAAEVAGLAQALRAKAKGPIACPKGILVDTCGTGGDGSNSVNISTLAALVVAATGVCVAKHGNRAVSSRCGSADLVANLGLPLHTEPASASQALASHGFAFLFAPAFHPAAGAVAGARRMLGTRTVFNLLGPLANPAHPTHQVLGASDPSTAHLMAQALSEQGLKRAFVVHGSPGWDEATPCGPFLRLDVRKNQVIEERIDPSAYGIPRCSPDELSGGDLARNTELARAFFSGAKGPIRDAVLLNAALVLEVTELVVSPRDALEKVAAVVDQGLVLNLIEDLTREDSPR